jgi:uncharacterized protein with PQ loop repeat
MGAVMMTMAYIGSVCMWVALIFYSVCFFPQIFENYKKKSGKGISDFMLTLILNGYLALVVYVYLLDLHISYKIVVPLNMLSTVVWIVQRVYYDASVEGKRWGLFYLLNIIAAISLIPLAVQFPIIAGNAGGWINIIVGTIGFVPQIAKIYRTRSVEGFSLSFVICNLIAGALELVGAILGLLPLQTKLTASRAIIVGIIFLMQFKFYGKKNA